MTMPNFDKIRMPMLLGGNNSDTLNGTKVLILFAVMVEMIVLSVVTVMTFFMVMKEMISLTVGQVMTSQRVVMVTIHIYLQKAMEMM